MANAAINPIINAILHRHSVRQYKPDVVPESVLNTILASGLSAPSALNKQSWHITVITRKALIDEMSAAIMEQAKDSPIFERIRSQHAHYHVFHQAPVVLMISGEVDDPRADINTGFLLGNVFLAAESLGVSACPIGFARFLFEGKSKEDYLAKLLIPNGYFPVLGFTLGYKQDDAEIKPPHALEIVQSREDKVTWL